MNPKKGYRYYAIVFLFSVFALGLYVGYLALKEGSIDYDLVNSLMLVPLMFTLFLFVFDLIFEKIFPSKAKQGNDQFQIYLDRVGKAITDQCEFGIEDYRRLRGNSSFQKSVEQAYKIIIDGETEEINFLFLDKKFKKNTNEYIALLVVVNEVKEMIENS